MNYSNIESNKLKINSRVGGWKRKHKHSIGNPKLKLVLISKTTRINSRECPPLVASSCLQSPISDECRWIFD